MRRIVASDDQDRRLPAIEKLDRTVVTQHRVGDVVLRPRLFGTVPPNRQQELMLCRSHAVLTGVELATAKKPAQTDASDQRSRVLFSRRAHHRLALAPWRGPRAPSARST